MPTAMNVCFTERTDDMDVLEIKYETGSMRLVVDGFFPCQLWIARKICPMIKQYCSEETQSELLYELNSLLEGYDALIEMYEKASEKSKGWKTALKSTKTLRRRMQRNIELLK